MRVRDNIGLRPIVSLKSSVFSGTKDEKGAWNLKQDLASDKPSSDVEIPENVEITDIPDFGLNSEEKMAETRPYLPSNDFHYIKGTDVNGGLVIKDSEGNQYVWVVVPKSLYNNTDYNSNGTKKPSSSEDYANIEYCLLQYSNQHTQSTFSDEYYADKYYADDENEGWYASEKDYTTAKNNMLKSVYENGGFYVGRYEAGITESRVDSPKKNSNEKYDTVGLPIPVSKANVFPYTHVTRTQAKKLAENVNSGNKTSGLMFGIQWNLVLAFMTDNETKDILTKDSTTIGNYKNNLWTIRNSKAQYSNDGLGNFGRCPNPLKKASEEPIMLTTGADKSFSIKNIYDIAGNVAEWTLALYAYDTDDPCVIGGGCYSDKGINYPATELENYSMDCEGRWAGFRVSIY